MNPGSAFGSGFGQSRLPSPFGTSSGSASGSSAPFGTGVGSGPSPQIFGSVNTTNTGFGNVGSSSGFGLSGGSDSRPPAFGSPGPSSSAGAVFGSSGLTGSSFGLGTSSPAFGAVTPSPGFGAGSNQSDRFGSSNLSAPGFGTSGFGTGTTSVSAAGNSGTQFGTGFNTGTTSASSSTASPAFGATSTGSSFKGPAFGTGGSGFGGGATPLGSSSSGFGTGSSGIGSSGSGFGTGSSGFGRGATGFGTSTPGFGQVSSGSSSVTPVFGATSASGFGGSSMFGSFTSPPSTSSTLSTAQNQNNPSFGGASVFGAKAPTTTAGGQGFMSSSSITPANPVGSSVFGSNVSSGMKGFGGGTTPTFGQTPATTVVGSATKGSAFGANTGVGSSGTSSVFGAVSKVGSFGTNAGTAGSVFGGGQPPLLGGFGPGGVAPPSYSASISSGQAGPFTASSTAAVFGGASRIAPGAPSVFGSASSSKTASGEGSVFGGTTTSPSEPGSIFSGAPKTPAEQGSVFGGASRTTSGQSVFGGASRTSSGEGTAFGGAPKTTSADGSTFGRVGRSVTKQDTLQQSTPHTASQPSVFGGSHSFGKVPAQSETLPSAAATHPPSSAASVFGGKSNFSSTFGGATQQPAPGMKSDMASSVFGGRQSHEQKRDLPSQPLFSAASRQMPGSGGLIKHDLDHSRGRSGAVTGGQASGLQQDSSQSQKRSAAGNEEGAVESKRGRTEDQQNRTVSSTRGLFRGQPNASSRTPERPIRRLMSVDLEDTTNKTTLVCKGIAANLNQAKTLRSHFSQFGKVKIVRPVPAKRYALVAFGSHEGAARAKKHGTMLPGQDMPLTIFWRFSGSDRSPGAPNDAAQSRLPWGRSGASESEPQPGGSGSQTQLQALPSSVAAELASMSGADADLGEGQKHSQDRSARSRMTRREVSPRRTETAQAARSRTPPPPSSSSSLSASTSGVSGASLSKTTNATVSSLRKMVGTTTMEKVNILDIRDKLIRQKTPKQTSGGIHSRAFVGTCPDMCPEKERLYREEVRRLSLYEIIPGSSTLTGSTSLVDHSRAVKEYSRSSADQDEPLPHELRPLPILTLTMNYLLVEIADCGEDGKWAEWYDFLWNRTRSIRKEITQQQLCSQEVVDLLEKCVRFHIYCAERLCMEDMMVFDSKINDENLTKCLQTLKELYADMQNKHGLYCPNEAEFRAYIVLMNLNEGDTLREVQQFRSEVRSSPEIAFAVKAYSALYSNNYVRFFRLVKNASFLNACILHRYFNQIRARAVQIILKSHTAGQKKVGFSLSELQRLLMFESEEEMREFCSYYGLQAEGADLVLDRAQYVEPETSIPSWRAAGLVEAKRRLAPVGEVINGGALQPVSLPAPQCSFDEQGRFIGSLEGLADDGQESAMKAPSSVKPPLLETPHSSLWQGVAANTAPTAPTPFSGIPAAAAAATAVSGDSSADARKQQLKTSGEVLKTIARDLFFEVINEHARQVAEVVMSEAQTKRQVEVHMAADLIASTVNDLAKQVSGEVVEGERTRQNQLLAAEKRERAARVAADVVDTIIEDTVTAEAKDVALREIEEEEARAESERKERCMLAIQSEVLREVLGEMAVDVGEDVHEVEVVARLKLLGELEKVLELKRCSQWLAVWRRALKVRQRQKRAMLDFPCAPPMQPASQRLQGLYPDRPAYAAALVPGKAALLLNQRAQITVSSPFEAEKRSLTLTARLSLAWLKSRLQRSQAWQPLHLASVLRSPLTQAVRHWPAHLVRAESSPLNVQWKLLLSLPGDMEEEEEEGEEGEDDRVTGGQNMPDRLMPVLKEWLCAKFTHGDSSANNNSNNNSAASAKRNVLSQYSIEVTSSAVTAPKLRVGVCVRNVPEFAKESRKEQPTKEQGVSITKGTSAILFLLPHADTTDDTTWLAARLRLARLLEAKPLLPATPLALLLPCALTTAAGPGSWTAEVTARMALQDFQDQGLVSHVAVVELAVRAGQPADVAVAVAAPAWQTQVSDAVKFLASNLPEPPDLRRERLGDVVEDTLTQHFFTPVLQDLRCRLHLNKLHQAPNTLIGLYNSVVDHICMALTSPSLQDISWPPPELLLSAATREDWNSTKHQGDIYELVSSLRLPWFHYQDSASTEWSQVCHDVWTFVNAVVKKRCTTAVSLSSRISRVLAHTCLQFENLCSLTQNEDHCTPTYVNAPWTDIVVACAEFRLQRLHNWKEDEEDVGGDLEVLFEEEELEEFEPPASWVQALLDSEDTDESQTVEDTMEHASIAHFALRPAEEEESVTESRAQSGRTADHTDRTSATATGSRSEQVRAAWHTALPDNVRCVWETSQNLLLHVEEERRQAQAFERYLQQALREDTTSPDWNCSAIFPSPSASRAVATPPAAAAAAAGGGGGGGGGVSSATPSIPSASLRQHGGSGRWLSTPQDPGRRGGGSLPLGHSMEPRRLAEQRSPGTDSFADRGGGAQEDRGRQETLPLSQGVALLKENLQAQKYANQLFEKRLQSLLES